MSKKTKNILVVGGSGFVGSYLCEKLINDGHEIIVVDNLLTGSTENINQLITNQKTILNHMLNLEKK